MKPPVFDYAAPGTVGEAVSLLAQHEGEAKILAGGQSLMPLLNMRLARPGLLVDLGRVSGLDYVREVDGGLAVGAMTTQRTVERSAVVASRNPLLHAAVRYIAHPQIRNRGTIGGSLAHADPAAECPAIALALDAELRVTGSGGTGQERTTERTISAADFFVTYLTTALAPTEVLTEVRFPALPDGTGWSFMEIARRHGDFALAGAVATLALDRSGRCAGARLVLFGVGSTPLRVRATEDALRGEKPSEKLIEQAAEKVAAVVDEPLTDVHASAEYRRHLAGVLARRSLTEAAGRAVAK
jgi:CO/xanthine dehydrogenase FAD-binding subunit